MMRPFPVVQLKFRFLLILILITREKGRRVPELCNRLPHVSGVSLTFWYSIIVCTFHFGKILFGCVLAARRDDVTDASGINWHIEFPFQYDYLLK